MVSFPTSPFLVIRVEKNAKYIAFNRLPVCGTSHTDTVLYNESVPLSFSCVNPPNRFPKKTNKRPSSTPCASLTWR